MAENTSESSGPPMPRGVGALMHHVRTHKIGTVLDHCICHAKLRENFVLCLWCLLYDQWPLHSCGVAENRLIIDESEKKECRVFF
jgi:hypothetical protein